MHKADVCVTYYGKPHQTIISILTLLQHSRKHINKIFITVEKKQPFGLYGDVYQVIQRIEPLIPIDLYYPKYFYDLDDLDYERAQREDDFRWSIPYQYALEKSDMDFLFIMHNDMVFHKDMIGEMLPSFEGNEKLAGTGSIGQCWSCPGYSAGLCHGSRFHEYVPTKDEAIALHQKYDTARKVKDLKVIETGRVHPMPECRLNEYACLIKLHAYRKTTLPGGSNVCFGGNWGGYTADLGTGWFYQMVNQGFQFKHFVLEDFAIHSKFNPVGQGIQANTKKDNYLKSEKNARQFLIENFGDGDTLTIQNTINAWTSVASNRTRDGLEKGTNMVGKVYSKIVSKK
jgi:hypothetical protein